MGLSEDGGGGGGCLPQRRFGDPITISVLVAAKGPYLCFLPKVVPFDEIAVYRSDPRHVTKLMSRSGGLDAVSTARARREGEF